MSFFPWVGLKLFRQDVEGLHQCVSVFTGATVLRDCHLYNCCQKSGVNPTTVPHVPLLVEVVTLSPRRRTEDSESKEEKFHPYGPNHRRLTRIT